MVIEMDCVILSSGGNVAGLAFLSKGQTEGEHFVRSLRESLLKRKAKQRARLKVGNGKLTLICKEEVVSFQLQSAQEAQLRKWQKYWRSLEWERCGAFGPGWILTSNPGAPSYKFEDLARA